MIILRPFRASNIIAILSPGRCPGLIPACQLAGIFPFQGKYVFLIHSLNLSLLLKKYRYVYSVGEAKRE
jgi:hypothetical protein